MRWLGKIQLTLLGVSAAAIIFIWPFYKKEMQVKQLGEEIEIFLTLNSSTFFLDQRCGYKSVEGNLLMLERTSQTSAEVKLCEERQKVSRERVKQRNLESLEPANCLGRFYQKHKNEFSKEDISKACKVAINQIRNSARFKRDYNNGN